MLAMVGGSSADILKGADENAAIPATGAEDLDLYERFAKRQEALAQISELDRKSWTELETGEIEAAAATKRRVVELSRSLLGARSWQTDEYAAEAAECDLLPALPRESQMLVCQARKADVDGQRAGGRGDAARAVVHLREAEAKYGGVLGKESILGSGCLVRLSQYELSTGDFRSARDHVAVAAAAMRKVLGEKHPHFGARLYQQAVAEFFLGEHQASEEHLRQAAAVIEPLVHDDFSVVGLNAQIQCKLSHLLNDLERYAEAEPPARQASEAFASMILQASPSFVECQVELARSYAGQGKNGEAEAVFTRLLNFVQPHRKPPAPPELTARVLAGYSQFLRSVHRIGDAAKLEARVRQLKAQPPAAAALPARDAPAASAAKERNGAVRR